MKVTSALSPALPRLTALFFITMDLILPSSPDGITFTAVPTCNSDQGSHLYDSTSFDIAERLLWAATPDMGNLHLDVLYESFWV